MNSKTLRNHATAFILNYLFGFLGVHKFYLGRPVVGVLYLVTFGFFGVGVLIDSFALAFMSANSFANKYNDGVVTERVGIWARIVVLLPVVWLGVVILLKMAGVELSD